MRISDWSSDVCSSDLIAGQMLEHGDIDRLGRRAQHRLVGRLGEVGQKLVERAEARGRIAPEQAGERREMMALDRRSEEHTSELQSLMRISYAVFCLKKTKAHRK